MAITRQDIDRLSELARLEFSEKEKTDLVGQINRILAYMEKIDELDLRVAGENVAEPDQATPLREDEAVPGFSAEEALGNAAKKEGVFFAVPKVVKGSS